MKPHKDDPNGRQGSEPNNSDLPDDLDLPDLSDEQELSSGRDRGHIGGDGPIVLLAPIHADAVYITEMESAGQQLAEPHDADRQFPTDLFDHLIRILRFTDFEQRIFTAHFRRGMEVDALSRHLGRPRAACRAVLDRVLDKLSSPPARAHMHSIGFTPAPRSLGAAYRRGVRWGLTPIPDFYSEVMSAEKLNVISTQQYRRKTTPKPGKNTLLIGNQMKPLTELRIELKGAQAKLQRLAESAHKANVRAEEAESDVSRISDEISAGQAAAAFEEKEFPSADLLKKLSIAKDRIVSTQSTLAAARAAVKQQSDVIDGIESEISSRQYASMLSAIAAPRAKVLQKLAETADVIREFYAAIGANGGAPGGIDDCFPPSDPTDRAADWSERLSLAHITDAIAAFDRGRQREGELGKPYYRRKVG